MGEHFNVGIPAGVKHYCVILQGEKVGKGEGEGIYNINGVQN